MALLLSLLLAAPPAGYARPELLAEARPLAAELAAGPLVLDCRSLADYQKGHVPGAVRVDSPAWAKAVGDGTDAAGWSKRLGDLGVNKGRRVVVYDAGKSRDAAHAWWVLRYWGVEDVRVLNGGFKAWLAAACPVETAAATPKPVALAARAQGERLATKADVLATLAAKSIQIIDTRSDGEFTGTQPMAGTRPGAIPGARHLEWDRLLDPTTQKFLPAPELAGRLAGAGIDLTAPCVTYCQGGVRASVMAFALELMGADPARNYHASWGEWGNDPTTPVVKP